SVGPLFPTKIFFRPGQLMTLIILKKCILRVTKPFFVAATLFLMVLLVSFFRSRSLHQEGEAAFTKGDFLTAVTSFERSALYYTPANPFYRRSIHGLSKIKDKVELQETLYPVQAENAITRVVSQTSPFGKINKKGAPFVPTGFFKNKTVFLLTHASFLGWISCSILALFKGFDENGSLRPVRAVSALSLALLCLGVWLFLIRFF
ncbi:MAG: hypothetical protein ACE5FU_11675, partial [Nitrospinota bacterium]